MKIVKGNISGCPILVLGKNRFVYLRMNEGAVSGATVGNVVVDREAFPGIEGSSPYTKPLTDEEEALAMKAMLLHGGD